MLAGSYSVAAGRKARNTRPAISFWWGNLDGRTSYELIIRAAVTDPGYQETLLVYDIRETDEGLEPEFLFEEPPYVQIRSSFSGDPRKTAACISGL